MPFSANSATRRYWGFLKMSGVAHNAKVVGILQARVSSTRLPGKVMRPLAGKPMLAQQIARVLRCQKLDALVVATSDQPSDDPIAALCASSGLACFRGSLTDVLDRFHRCAAAYDAQHVVRLTGDCPLADPGLIDELVAFYLALRVDYASNCRPPTLPDGLDAEIFSFDALQAAWREARDPFEREHVVPFIVRNPQRFLAANLSYAEDLSAQRWTVDEPEDFAFVEEVFAALHAAKPEFGYRDVLALLQQRPEIAAINRHFKRNAASVRN